MLSVSVQNFYTGWRIKKLTCMLNVDRAI